MSGAPTAKSTNLGLNLPTAGNPDLGSGGTTTDQIVAAIKAHDALFGNVDIITAAGAIPLAAVLSGYVGLKAGAVVAVTLAAPVAGSIASGGNDGQEVTINSEDAYAYTVTTPANAINGNKHIATWGGAGGDSIVLVARNGVWWQKGAANGVTLS